MGGEARTGSVGGMEEELEEIGEGAEAAVAASVEKPKCAACKEDGGDGDAVDLHLA